ncbi:MAG: DUF4352 domain-containing protein [Nitrosopumilus sp.]|nr:DUF4352 domain-containing protein [Nitrosopumilus sp.]
MAGIGLVIVIAAIVISMAAALYTYTQYQTNFITVNAGEAVIVGPVQYFITFDGTNSGNKETQPENTFVKILIDAENISQESTRISGGQFYLVDENDKKYEAVYGGFSEKDLLNHKFDPGKPTSWTTQFDVPYDEQEKYHIVIRPLKEQSTVDTAMICITNC